MCHSAFPCDRCRPDFAGIRGPLLNWLSLGWVLCPLYYTSVMIVLNTYSQCLIRNRTRKHLTL